MPNIHFMHDFDEFFQMQNVLCENLLPSILSKHLIHLMGIIIGDSDTIISKFKHFVNQQYIPFRDEFESNKDKFDQI